MAISCVCVCVCVCFSACVYVYVFCTYGLAFMTCNVAFYFLLTAS